MKKLYMDKRKRQEEKTKENEKGRKYGRIKM